MFPCGITLLNFILSQQTKNNYYLRPTLYSQTYYVPKFSSSKTILPLQIKGGYNCVQYYKERLDLISRCPDIQEKNTTFYDCSIDLDLRL